MKSVELLRLRSAAAFDPPSPPLVPPGPLLPSRDAELVADAGVMVMDGTVTREAWGMFGALGHFCMAADGAWGGGMESMVRSGSCQRIQTDHDDRKILSKMFNNNPLSVWASTV